LFDDQETKTLNDICVFFKKVGPEKLSQLSAQEKGYLETDEADFINYKYSKNLAVS